MKIFEFDYELDVPHITPEEEEATSDWVNNTSRFFDDRVILEDNLRSLGWYEIGFGAFSIVFANSKKSSYVLKLNKQPDPGYEQYVNLIHEHPNKYYPQISDKKLLKAGEQNFYVYLIEKLQHISYRTSRDWSEALETIIANYSQPISELFPDGVPIYSRKFGFNIDIHDENIMQRANGDLVITDPYSMFHTFNLSHTGK
jgi:hypothetical protein